MSASTAAMFGINSLFSGGMKIVNSLQNNMINNAQNNISSSMQIAQTLSKGAWDASQSRIKALSYDRDASNIRSNLKDELRVFDEKSSANIGKLKTEYLSSGVELSGSALHVLAAAENDVARSRMARQALADADAFDREFMADQLRLNSEFEMQRATEKADFIRFENSFANKIGRLRLGTSITDTMFSSVFGAAKNINSNL